MKAYTARTIEEVEAAGEAAYLHDYFTAAPEAAASNLARDLLAHADMLTETDPYAVDQGVEFVEALAAELAGWLLDARQDDEEGQT